MLHAVDRFGWDGAFRNGRGARRENARGAWRCLQCAALVWFGGNHAVQINEQNQASVRGDGRAGEKFYAAQVFAEALDYDFVFADNFFDNQANLTVVCVGNDHAEIAIDRFECWQSEVGVQADDFGDDVAHLCEELAADVFDFIRANPADFFDDRKR